MINDKTMKCTSIFFSLLVIATSIAAQPNYDFTKLKREHLGRGVIAIRENPSTVAVSWRYLSSDPMDESFDIYRDGKKVNKHPLKNATFFQDSYQGTAPALYTVKAIKDTCTFHSLIINQSVLVIFRITTCKSKRYGL